MKQADFPRPAIAVLATLRGILKLALNMETGFRGRRSSFLRTARRRAKRCFPPNPEGWCRMVGRHRQKDCRTSWDDLIRRAARNGGVVRRRCFAGLLQVGVPVRRHGRTIGVMLAAQAVHPSEGSGFERAHALVRDMGGTREEWLKCYRLLPALPWKRLAMIMRLSGRMVEQVLDLARAGGHEFPPSQFNAAGEGRVVSAFGPGTVRGAEARRKTLVERARKHLETHWNERISARAVSSALGCSPFALSRAFRRSMGTTIPGYLNRSRLKKAKELLLDTAYSVGEIATLAGFGTRRRFFSVFKEDTGQSPQGFRRRNWLRTQKEKS